MNMILKFITISIMFKINLKYLILRGNYGNKEVKKLNKNF